MHTVRFLAVKSAAKSQPTAATTATASSARLARREIQLAAPALLPALRHPESLRISARKKSIRNYAFAPLRLEISR